MQDADLENDQRAELPGTRTKEPHEEVAVSKVKAAFVEPMLLLRTDSLPDDAGQWKYEIKHDGYRAIAFNTGGKLYLRSRIDNDFATRYPAIATALAALPNDTAIDREIVAFDEAGKPSFNLLQNHGSSGVPLFFVDTRHDTIRPDATEPPFAFPPSSETGAHWRLSVSFWGRRASFPQGQRHEHKRAEAVAPLTRLSRDQAWDA
jgi:ATP dependent DNA ligase domain